MDSSAANSTMEPVTTRSLPSARAIDAPSKSRPSLLAALRKPATGSSESASESESDGSVSEDESITTAAYTTLPTTAKLPAGDIAAEQEEESDDEAAYERMKKRLAASKTAAEAPKALSEPSAYTPPTDSEDDEMPVRMNGRRSAAKQLDITSPKGTTSSDLQSCHSSPGLFVTPNASPVTKKTTRRIANEDSESDAMLSPHNADLQERIQRIRAERLARQQEEGEQQVKAKKISRRRVDQASGSDTDGENGRRLTQQAKPTRKAGKKALEAMARDQQRISRNMQLAHQAKTKKRYTTKDLFARLGFNSPHDEVAAVVQLPTPGASSALTSSDAEGNQARDTPPTSPPRQGLLTSPKPTSPEIAVSRTSVISPKTAISGVPLDKGKGRADLATAMVELSDSEDEPAVVQPKSRFAVFDRLPARKEQESASLLHLRSLAQLRKSPPKAKKGQKQVSLAEMEFSLAQKARQQAQQEREEKIAELRRRGHVIETEEEREKAQMQIEDMVVQFEKQRQEDLKLSKLERSEAKKNGETIDDLPSSDESDEDYVGSGNEREDVEQADDEDEAELELSGSEDEVMGSDEEAEDDVDDDSNALVDGMADEDEEAEVDDASGPKDDADEAMDDEDMVRPQRKSMVSKTRNRTIIVDDEESDTEVPMDSSPTQPATQDDAMAAFGFAQPNDSLGLTQMFAGTMANLESVSQSTSQANPEQDSFDFLRNLPDTQPGAFFTQASDPLVPNSQSLMSPQKDAPSGASQFSLGISQLIETSPAFSRTQLEDFEPTQDAGFSFSRSPAGLVAPTSTVDTVMMSIMESPVKERKGKLQRGRKEATVELSDVEENFAESEAELSEDDIQRPPKPRDAFSHMKKGAKKQKALEEFNKKTSMAKDAVMEQAEESEDEYAGIGGASDDEEGEEDEFLKEMIDHNDVKVDERQLAAFYADKAKKDDAKNIAELYKKIQTGGLRRQAGDRDGFDMSDSEDEVERRQRRKQAEFQKNVKALLKDDRVKEISKDEKKKAFFNTLADFADEGDYDFLDVPADMGMDLDPVASQEDVQQSENTEEVIPDSQADAVNMPAPSNPLKRKSPDSQKENRPPPNLRRTAASDTLMARKPITFADVQHSVSELLEDPHIMVPDSQYSESEDDESPAPSLSSRKPIIDRLTLSRTSTASDSSHTDNANVAFHASSRASAAPGFRVPSLIRRATSNISTASERSSSTAKTASDNSGVRRGGTGRSNIHAQAREAERRALLDKKDGKRKEALRKKVEGGRKRAGGIRSVLGSLGGGFE